MQTIMHDCKTALERKGLRVNVGKTKALSMPVKLKTIAALDPAVFVASELVLTP